jgi:diguanylate cyclase (GGDEF)-like protein
VPNKATILIVDDVKLNIQILTAILKDLYQIIIAVNGKQAIELVNNKPDIDLILLDIEMPVMGGFEACEHLKNDPKTEHIPIIFITANTDEEDEERGLELGAIDYITKPIRQSIVCARVKTHITLKQQYDLLRSLAVKDQLTGLYNRHYLLDVACKKISQSVRHNYDLSLLLLDIDHFKHINDTYGHPMGDKILIAVAKTLLQQCRKEDAVIRFGGEEFIVVLEHSDKENSKVKAEQIRHAIELLQPENIKVTISIGLTQMQGDENIEKMISRADIALYKAKENGRNCVVLSDD